MSDETHDDPRFDSEKWWTRLQPFLEELGYLLRPRYHPDWTPAYLQDGKGKSTYWDHEDSIPQRFYKILDAKRISDGALVTLKALEANTDEQFFMEYFNSTEQLKDPNNHAVPLLEVIGLPEELWRHEDGIISSVLMVMPCLRQIYTPPFHCLSEFIEAFQQFLEGLEFMHRHNITHRDACSHNMLLDATNLIPCGFHPSRDFLQPDGQTWVSYLRRCEVSPVRYYFIDFEFSMKFSDPETARVTGRWGQIKDIPEMQKPDPYNPFKADVYQVGASFLKIFKDYQGLTDFLPLLHQMTAPSPDDRPSAAKALEDLRALVAEMDARTLRRRIWLTKDSEPAPRKIIHLPRWLSSLSTSLRRV